MYKIVNKVTFIVADNIKAYIKKSVNLYINWLIFVSIVKMNKKVVDNYFVGTNNESESS